MKHKYTFEEQKQIVSDFIKLRKKEKEWLENPTIEINMNDGELEIVGNPFDKEEKDVQSNTKRKVQGKKNRSEHSD